jgi:hypothetical protein
MDSALQAAAEKDIQESQLLSKDQKKRSRKAFMEMAELRKADLEWWMKIDTSGWTDKRKATHQQTIDTRTSKVEADNDHQKKQALKRSKSVSTATVRAPQMKEDETRRLIYARKAMDVEFENKTINAAISKWDMVAKKYNNGFVVKKRLLAGAEDDIISPALPEGENETSGVFGSSQQLFLALSCHE